MYKHSGSTWYTRARPIAVSVSMLIGVIFRFLGKNPFDPFNLWGTNSLNLPFLGISAIAFIAATILSYATLSLAQAEATGKDMSVGKEPPSPWYGDINTMLMNRLAYGVLLPGLCIMEILQIVAVISHLEIFSWLALVSLLIAMIADIVAVILIIKGVYQRTRRRVKEQEMEQQASR